MDFDIKYNIFILIVCIVLLLVCTLGHNACTAQDWNNGICPRCNKRYELKAASQYFKYYACPVCYKEVSRSK